MTVRIGLIDYLNTQPFQHGLRSRLADKGVHFVTGVPTELNRKLLRGEIDLAPISSIVAATSADHLRILPGHSISSRQAVGTVLLFSKYQRLSELDGKSVAVSDQSATSVALLRIILEQGHGAKAEFVVTPQDEGTMLERHSAALLIGDGALVASYHAMRLNGDLNDSEQRHVFDLGVEWFRMTQLPFTYALWAARKEAVATIVDLEINQQLHRSKVQGLQALPQIAERYSQRIGVPAEVCLDYLRRLRFNFGEEEQAGLNAFLVRAVPEYESESLRFTESNPAEPDRTA